MEAAQLSSAISFGGILLAGMFILATRARSPFHHYACAAGLGCLTAFLVSITLSRLYWGYWISRPRLASQLETLSHVDFLVPVEVQADPTGRARFAVHQDPYFWDLERAVRHVREDPYYATYERILPYLRNRGLLPDQYSQNLGLLPDVHPLIQASGAIVEPEPGYSGGLYRGLMLGGRARSGGALLWIGMHGSQVSNDHYPQYEFLLHQERSGQAWKLVHDGHFFYDVAGIEGLEWYVGFPFLAGPLIFLSLVSFHGIVRIRSRLKPSPAGQPS